MQMIRRIQITECIAIILIIIGLMLLTPLNKIIIFSTPTSLAIMMIVLGVLLFLAKKIEKKKLQTTVEQLKKCLNQANQLKMHIDFIEKNDPKTLLPNYEQLKEIIEQEIQDSKQHKQEFCMIYIDIDKLESINEEFGRSIGDDLLTQLSSRLSELFRKPNFVSRIGDDEFCLIIADIKSSYHVDKTIRRITRLLNIPYHINEHDVYSSVTAGIACFPHNGETFHELISGAKIALSNAKKECRGGYRFLTTDLHKQHIRFIHLESELRIATENNQFELHYQPQFSLNDKQMIGLECLIRWNNSVLGMISPVEFIPLAENLGLLYKITDWVISTGVTQMSRWHAMGLSEFQLAINLSADKFQNPRFLPNFLEQIAALKILPSNIEFEITEVIVNQLVEFGKNNIHEIAESGIKISIDDFGTGYSSLSRLTSLPINTLKIDKSFVSNFDKRSENKKIIETIINLGRNLNMGVLAEGIETETQLQFLIEKGCQFGQGYLYSKPLNTESTTQFLKKRLQKKIGEGA